MSFFNVIRRKWYEMRIRSYVLDRVDFLLDNPPPKSDDPVDLTQQLVDLKSIVLGYLQLIYAVHEPTDVSTFVSACACLAGPTGSTVSVHGGGASTTEIGYVVAFDNLAKCGKCEFKIRIHKMQSMN